MFLLRLSVVDLSGLTTASGFGAEYGVGPLFVYGKNPLNVAYAHASGLLKRCEHTGAPTTLDARGRFLHTRNQGRHVSVSLIKL